MKSPAFDLDSYIMHHLTDLDAWHLPLIKPIALHENFSLHALMLVLCGIFLITLFCVIYQRKQRVPSGMTNALEAMVSFIRNEVSIAYLGEDDGKKMAPLFCTFFFFILMLNVMGLIPLFATATANVNVTAGLAVITLTFMIGGALYKNGVKGFFKAITPSGVPFPILFLLVPLELFGIIIKTFSLTIRLFANMLAGHIVIISLLGIIVLMGYAALPAIFLAVAIYMLEVLVAFLQAYIFTLLSAMFIGQMMHPEH